MATVHLCSAFIGRFLSVNLHFLSILDWSKNDSDRQDSAVAKNLFYLFLGQLKAESVGLAAGKGTAIGLYFRPGKILRMSSDNFLPRYLRFRIFFPRNIFGPIGGSPAFDTAWQS